MEVLFSHSTQRGKNADNQYIVTSHMYVTIPSATTIKIIERDALRNTINKSRCDSLKCSNNT